MKKNSYLRTSDLAKAVGVHPNTVRLYEEWGYLPQVPRSSANYRLFTEQHLAHMRLAQTLLQWPYPGGKKQVISLVRQAAKGDLGGALENTYLYLGRVRAEIVQTESATELLERWASGKFTEKTRMVFTMKEVVDLLGVTQDTLRNWERNGLIKVPRNPRNGYRLYGATEISRLRIIRMLRHAGYSLMAILRMLMQFDKGQTHDLKQVLDTPRLDEDIYSVADQWLSTLQDIEKRVRAAISLLEEMIETQQTLQ